MSASTKPHDSAAAAPHAPAKKGGLFGTVLKIVLAIALIAWLYHAGALDPRTFMKIATPGLVIFCALSVFLQIYVNNYRWLVLLRGQNFETTIGRTLPLSFIGMFFNFAMPGGVGGDVVKGYYVVQEHPRQKFAAALSIFMDRVVGFFVMIGTAFIALLFSWGVVQNDTQLKSVALGVTLLFAGFLVFFFLSFSTLLQKSALSRLLFEKLPGGSKIKEVYEALHSYRHSPGSFLLAIALSVVNQLLMVAFVYAIAQAMGETTIPISAYFFLVPVGTVVQALPISPAGIGVGQAAFFFLFNHYLGRRSEIGPTSVTVMQVINFAWGLLGLYFYLSRKKPSQMPESMIDA